MRLIGAAGPDSPTWARIEESDRRRLALLRQNDREHRLRALDAIRGAEALYEFADSLRAPAPLALCAPGGQRRVTFGELVALTTARTRGFALPDSWGAGTLWAMMASDRTMAGPWRYGFRGCDRR
jgi:hypothetical protein